MMTLNRSLMLLVWGFAMVVGVSSAFGQLDQFSFDKGQDFDEPVTVVGFVSADQVAQGGNFVVGVVLNHGEGYHTWPNEPIVPEALGDFPAYATSISVELGEGLRGGPVQWPEMHGVEVRFLGDPIELLTYDKRAIAYVPVQVAGDAAIGSMTIPVSVSYQACDDFTCYPPTTNELSVTIEVVGAGEVVANANDDEGIFDGFDPSVFADQSAWGDVIDSGSSGEGASQERKFLGMFVLPPIDTAAGIGVIALAAALGGFILNLTPCVLPVIPLKVMTITNHAGESKSRVLVLGSAMAIGVIAFWFGIGIPVAFVSGFVDPSIIFGVWWVTLIIGVLIAAMGVGIMGVFSINLPQKAYMINPKADSVQGSFMFGMMTAVLGLPCFGFVAGALLAGAATMQAWQVLVIFFSLGFGMAFPYFVLSMNPQWMNKLPKTGPASDLVKQIMGLLMLAASAYFLGTTMISVSSSQGWSTPWWFKTVHWWVIALFAVMAGVWLLVRTIMISKKTMNRLSFALIGLVMSVLGVAVAANQTSHQYHYFWEPYSEEALEEALGSGKVVVLDFTAEWCLNCKTLEAAVLAVDPVKSLLLGSDVVPMVADVTSTSAPGWDKLRELEQTGIPLLVVYEPGNLEPVWLSNAYSSKQVVEAIEGAMGLSEAVSVGP